MGRKPKPEKQKRFEQNCENFLRALYGVQKENQAFYYSVEYQGQTFTRAQAIAAEITHYLSPHGPWRQNWVQIVVLFYGLDPHGPRRWNQKDIAKKLELNESTVQIQRYGALKEISKSPLLEKFFI